MSASDTLELADYVDLVDAAALLRIHPQSLRRLVKQRRVPALQFCGKWLFQRAMLQQFTTVYDPRPGRKRWGRLL